MIVLRWLGRFVLVTIALIVIPNVLLPAVARAQMATSGNVTTAQVLAALVGQTVAAERYTASATTGTAYQCDAVLSSCVDTGPGANNGIGTDASGRVLLATGAGTGVVRIGDGSQVELAENGNFTLTNGALIFTGTTFIVNQTANSPVLVDSANGFKVAPKTLPTCAAAIEWTEVSDAASGVATGARSRRCMCTSDGAGAYAWQNLATGTVDTATTCAP